MLEDDLPKAVELIGTTAPEVVVFTPYIDDLTNSIASSLAEAGFPVLNAAGMGIRANLEIGRVTPPEIINFVEPQIDGCAPDCVFPSCTTGAQIEAIEPLQRTLGIAVVSSNQAAIDVVRQAAANPPSRHIANLTVSLAAGNTIAAGEVGARTISKLRSRLIPLLFLLYVVAYLDRINIGFAALKMNTASGITSAQFGLLVGIFFWGYFIFEIPSNLLLHKTGARIWIARILISWGTVAMLTGAVHSLPQLYVVRFLLGVAEAGFFPGIILYLGLIGSRLASKRA